MLLPLLPPPTFALALTLALALALAPLSRAASAPATLNHTARYHTHTLTFTSTVPATLFINGIRKAALKRAATLHLPFHAPLPVGTVLTVIAAPPHPPRPHLPLAVTVSGSAAEVTSTAWRGHFVKKRVASLAKAVHSFPYYDVCRWEPVRRVPIKAGSVGGDAAPVWPQGSCGKGYVARMRYVVGGADDAQCAVARPRKHWAIVSVAATDRAWVFVNGRHVMDVDSRRQTRAKRLRLAKGDVISLKAMDVRLAGVSSEFGFAVDVRYRGRRIVTTDDAGGEWRVTAMYKALDDVNQFTFMRGAFDDCSWHVPVLPRYPPNRKAVPFPWKHGAKYVWARNAQHEGGVVFARLQIEADPDRCDGDNVAGYSGPSTALCDCEMADSSNSSICFYFKDWRKHRCESRPCEPNYYCTGRDATPDSMLCVKKDIPHRIVFKEEVDGEKICSLDRDPHHIYVPYHNNV